MVVSKMATAKDFAIDCWHRTIDSQNVIDFNGYTLMMNLPLSTHQASPRRSHLDRFQAKSEETPCHYR